LNHLGITCINDNFLEKILLETKTATIPNSFPFAGLFEVCYSSDNGNSWFKQENIEVNAFPKAATATSITKIGHYGTVYIFFFLSFFLSFSIFLFFFSPCRNQLKPPSHYMLE